MGMRIVGEEWVDDIADWKTARMTVPAMLNRKAREEGSHSMGRPLWRLLMLETQEEETPELSCEECLSVLDYYIDWIAAGGDLQRLQLAISKHLYHCLDCRQEMEKRLKQWERFAGDQDGQGSKRE
jgi:hypothetical protein